MYTLVVVALLCFGGVFSDDMLPQQRDCDKIKCDSSIRRPVCGNNFVTYNSTCDFHKEHCRLANEGTKIKLDYHGRCCKWKCDWEWDPVCGSNGKTIFNKCQHKYYSCVSKKRYGVPILEADKGICVDVCSRVCPTRLEPVCASDGRTYRNICFFKTKQCKKRKSNSLKVKHVGACKHVCKSGAKCPIDYDPVCGSDGKTYGNACELKVAACQLKYMGHHKMLNVSFRGECNDHCVSICPPQYKPVCGSDGRTHANICFLRMASCQNRLQNRASITVQPNIETREDGACKYEDGNSLCVQKCPTLDYEVCGTDGKTYANLCELEKAACNAVKNGFRGPTLKYQGYCKDSPCEQRTCLLSKKPICGTDFKTYNNVCQMRIAACRAYKVMKENWMEKEEDDKMDPRKNWEEKEKDDKRDQTEGWWPIRTFYLGECRSDQVRDWSDHLKQDYCKEYKPLCTHDGTTYPNICYMKVANLFKQAETGKTVELKYKGICREFNM